MSQELKRSMKSVFWSWGQHTEVTNESTSICYLTVMYLWTLWCDLCC